MSNVLAVLVFAMVLGALGVYVELQGIEWPKRRRPHYVRTLLPHGPAPTPYSEPGDRTSPPAGSPPAGSLLGDPWPLPKRSVQPQPLSEDAGGAEPVEPVEPVEPGPPLGAADPVDSADPEFEWFHEAVSADSPPSDDDHLDELPREPDFAGWFSGVPVQRVPMHDSLDPELASGYRDHESVHRVDLR